MFLTLIGTRVCEKMAVIVISMFTLYIVPQLGDT